MDQETSTWQAKSWSGSTTINGQYIWSDGENIYSSYSNSSYNRQFVLNKATSTWSSKTWSTAPRIDGRYIWTDGDNIYYSPVNQEPTQLLNRATKYKTLSLKPYLGQNI